MKSILLTGAFLAAFTSFGQNFVTTSASDNWVGYVNVFDLSMNYQFGSTWAVPDLQTSLNTTGDQVILYPNFNTYADNSTDPFWVDQTTGDGQKILEASTYVEPGAGFNGQDLTFTGNVVSYTLDAAYEAKFFIKALDPANSYQDALSGAYVFDIPASGDFTVTVTGAELATGLVVQYGFAIIGVNANPANEVALGNIVIEGSTLSISEPNISVSSVYPNPANDIVYVNSDDNIYSYCIYGLNGSKIMEGVNAEAIDVSDLKSGMYIIELNSDNGIERQKIQIK